MPDSLYKSFPQVVISDQEKMSVASKIAANVIKMAPAGPVSYESFNFELTKKFRGYFLSGQTW